MGLDAVELIMETENAFGIRLTDVEAETVRTVGDLAELVEHKLALSAGPLGVQPRARGEIDAEVIRLVGGVLGIDRESISLQSRLVDDLGFD
ncbi:MAG: phosphopantetheine-binding protein [Phycisphaerales bacterium JB041]